MLYKLNVEKENSLSQMPFYGLSELDLSEKELEGLIADNLLNVLHEESPLMPIYREKKGQALADLYALNENGDLIIFELKLGKAYSGAAGQALRYAQDAGNWTFNDLSEKYKIYAEENNLESTNLLDAHQEAFELEEEHKLKPNDLNRNQHLQIIGRAADRKLIRTVKYWKNNGVSITFLPYRVYKIKDNYYFELFSPPYDRHYNTKDKKGVLFDTNKTYSNESVWHMLENNRVSAFGPAAKNVDYLNEKDIVFYSHKNTGIIAAAEVVSSVKEDEFENNIEKYREVEFLTPKPSRNKGINKYLKFQEVSELLSKSFYWARTIKSPYLDKEEAKKLVKELNKKLE